jgi:hypothetical protein
MSEAYTSVGTLSDERTVILDQPIRAPLGRVRVIVEPLSDAPPETTWLDKLHAIRQALRESGYRSRSREEIDREIRSEREAWDKGP